MRCPVAASRTPTTPKPPPLIVIAGATATGKTALSIELAQHIDGAEIISADSRQVYRGMDIGTAKPTPKERATAPHHGLDLVDPDEPFTASDYQHVATDALRGIAERDGVALLVGGTGLYLRAIARGLPLDQGDTDPDVRAGLDERFADDGLDALVAELRERDSEAARGVDLRNPRRVIRALERAIVTGSAAPPRPRGYGAPVTWLGLTRRPVEHRNAIAERVDEHFAGGLLEEAERLRRRYPGDLPAFTAMGYREAFDVLADRTDVDTAKADDARRTWAYVRRQRTWFRSEPGVVWLEAGDDAAAAALDHVSRFLERIDQDRYAGRR